MTNASAVSRYLGKKFTKGEEWASGAVRGWINFSAGYVVRRQSDGSVRVEYQEGDSARANSEEIKEERAKRELGHYRKYLAQRYTVELVEPGLTYRTNWLKVTDRTAPGPTGPMTELPKGVAQAVSRLAGELYLEGSRNRTSAVSVRAEELSGELRGVVLDAINADRADWAERFDSQCGAHGRANGPGLLLAALLIRPEETERW